MNPSSSATMSNISVCPDSLSDEQILQYQKEGYLAFSDVLNTDQIEQARQSLQRIVREMTEGEEFQYTPPSQGKRGNQRGATYGHRHRPLLIQLEGGFDPIGRSHEEIDSNVRKFMWFCQEDRVFQEMVTEGSRLHGVVASLIGKAPILFQEMALVKPAFVGSEKPWHQDNAYFSVSPLDSVLGVWLALDDAGLENGCMHVIPAGHREGGFKHHHGTDCEIDPSLLAVERARAVPLPAGGALFFHGMLPHETPQNRSPFRRRALQFHYRGAETKILDDEAYDALFIDRRGAAASCRSASRLGF